MLERVGTGDLSLGAYRGTAPDEILDRIDARAAELRGARILHLNATAYGGGVSELLRSGVPLLNDLGMVAEWQVIAGDETFFQVTKKLHNALQGSQVDLTSAERDRYLQAARDNAGRLADQRYDFVFAHDPQTAAIRAMRDGDLGRWIWRCHIDTSSANARAWELLLPFVRAHDATVFTMREFLPAELPVDRVAIIPPAIDPLSPKNLELGHDLARRVLEWVGIETDRPFVTQVSRFDPWKDPLGVIEAYRLARQEVPELELVLAGSMALDDPEGWEIHREVSAASKADPAIHILTNLTGVGNIEVNALQRLADVVVQKSTREGFGLVVSEALWKGTPVVAGRAGGIPLQMADGAGGALVDDVAGCASAIVSMLRNRPAAKAAGATGRERVRRQFLLPRLLLDELDLMAALAGGEPLAEAILSPGHDPVCGMAVTETERQLVANHAGKTYRFCSEGCRARFEQHPGRYLQRVATG